MSCLPIKPNYSIPKGYDRLFYLEERGTNFKEIIIANDEGIWHRECGKPTPRGKSMSFDWTQWAMTFIEMDCREKTDNSL